MCGLVYKCFNFHYEAPEFVTDLLFYNNAFVVIKSSSFSRLRMWAPVYRIVLMPNGGGGLAWLYKVD